MTDKFPKGLSPSDLVDSRFVLPADEAEELGLSGVTLAALNVRLAREQEFFRATFRRSIESLTKGSDDADFALDVMMSAAFRRGFQLGHRSNERGEI